MDRQTDTHTHRRSNLSTYRDSLISVVYVKAVLLPGDGGLWVPAGGHALHHGRLARRHHHIHRVLPEVVSQDCGEGDKQR